MTLYYIEKRFVLDCAPKDYPVARAAGMLWDSRRREYWTRSPEVALKLKPFWSRQIKGVFEIIEKRRATLEESRALDADIEIPAPPGLSYLGYQRAGIAWCNKRPNTLLGDEMGLGKTIQAIGLINLDPSIKRVLVVCPASLKMNWMNELRRWLVDERRSIDIAEGGKFPRHADITIINYDILLRHAEVIRDRKWDLVVPDEIHFAKNSKSKRAKALFGGILDRKRIKPIPTRKRVYITGTPIVNRPAEIWPIIHSLDPATWSNWPEFMRRYCSGPTADGIGGLEELQKRLRASIMIRRLKADVLTDLPPKLRQVIEIPANTSRLAALVSRQQSMFAGQREAIMSMQETIAKAEIAKDAEGYRRAVSRLQDSMKIEFTEISKIRHETATAKIPYNIEHIGQSLEAGKKIVVFGHHEDVLVSIHKAFPNSVVVYGKTPMNDRQRHVDAFQRDPRINLFVGGFIPAGVGYTLTESSHVICAELDWVPGNITQAEDRCHRLGQRDSVLVQHLVLAGSIDAYMARVVISKQEVIEQALDIIEGETRPVATAPAASTIAKPVALRPAVRTNEQTELF